MRPDMDPREYRAAQQRAERRMLAAQDPRNSNMSLVRQHAPQFMRTLVEIRMLPQVRA